MPKKAKAAGVNIPKVWANFLDELDASLMQPVEIHCLGGFVMTFGYGLTQPTSDVDYLRMLPADQSRALLQLAGKDSALHHKYGLYLQHVGVATPPEDYESRLRRLFPGRFKNLRLMGLDPYDLALSKLERNTPIDREDVKYLCKAIPLDPSVLRARYEKELRPNLGNPNRDDLTLKLWLEAFFPDQASPAGT